MTVGGSGTTGLKKDPDELLRLLGNPGRFQLLQFFLLSTQYFPISFNDLMPIFYSIPPKEVHCIGELTLNKTSQNATDHCSCPNGRTYVYPERQWSIVGDMDLVCEREYLVNLASAMYFFGSLIGGIFWGELADRYGRRNCLMVTNIMYTVFSAATIFSRDAISFIIVRFGTGFVLQGMAGSFYVIIMEWMPSGRRGFFATICQFFFSIAGILLPGIAYVLQDWRLIQIFLAVSNVSALTYYWFAPEPMQWLFLNRQTQTAKENFEWIAKFNRVNLSDEDLSNVDTYSLPGDVDPSVPKTSMLDCFRTPQIRRITFLSFIAWFATFMSYIGTSFVISDVAPNLYVNLAISGLLELIPCGMATFLVGRFGARKPLLAYFIIGGALMIATGAVPGNAEPLNITRNVFAILGKMALLGCMSTITFFTVELFPTVIRSAAFGICAAGMHSGGMLAQQVFLINTVIDFKGAPAIILGVVALFGATATFFLPETMGLKLPDTIEEAETMLADSPAPSPLLRLRKSVKVASVGTETDQDFVDIPLNRFVVGTPLSLRQTRSHAL